MDHVSQRGGGGGGCFTFHVSYKSSFTFYPHYNLFTDICFLSLDRLVLISFNMYNPPICIDL